MIKFSFYLKCIIYHAYFYYYLSIIRYDEMLPILSVPIYRYCNLQEIQNWRHFPIMEKYSKQYSYDNI